MCSLKWLHDFDIFFSFFRVPNKATHGYDEGLIESTEGEKVTVMILENKEVIIL